MLVTAISPELDAPSRPPRDPVQPWPFAVAAVVHVVLIGGMAALIATPSRLPTPPSVPVEFVSPQEYQAFQQRAARVPTEPAPPGTPVPQPAPATTDAMTVATTLFAGAILADPANQRIRDALPTLERSERIIQLCNLEGLEQLRLAAPGTLPDYLVTYAFSEPNVAGYTLDAPGAAFHEGASWHRVRLTCTVDAGFAAVTDFRFDVGDVIPETEWAAHNLMALDPDDHDE